MNFAIHVRDARARQAVIAAILALPADVTRFAKRECVFVGVGETSRGLAVAPSQRWLIVLDEREPDAATVGHEIAHALMGHRGREVRHERQAAALAASWGLEGDAADAASCERRFRPEERGPFQCRVVGRDLHVECDCGNRRCCTSRANVPGAVLVTCLRCVRRELLDLNELPGLACPACGVDGALSVARDGLPGLVAARYDGVRGLLVWLRRGAPGVLRWLRAGVPGVFGVAWTADGAVRISCGTCRAQSTLRITTRGEADRDFARRETAAPSPDGCGDRARRPGLTPESL